MSAPLTPQAAMDRAVALAALGPAHGPNPRVGAVIVDAEGRVLGEGFHRGAGTPHAEVAAISAALALGHSLAGSTAYVTLEPCSHTGRTGPCTQALANAGVARVVFAVADPNPAATGGGQILTAQGIPARLEPHGAAAALNARWLSAMRLGRPHVIAKWAQTLDGRTSAADGTSFWITGEEAREHVHQVRASADAIVVGTGTVMEDDPRLTARPGGQETARQPLRVVMGLRDTREARIWQGHGTLALHTHDPAELLAELWAREARTVIVEGGATVTTAFLRAGLVDELNVYIAPALLGAGTSAVGDLGIVTMADALRGSRSHSAALGTDTLMTVHLRKEQ